MRDFCKGCHYLMKGEDGKERCFKDGVGGFHADDAFVTCKFRITDKEFQKLKDAYAGARKQD